MKMLVIVTTLLLFARPFWPVVEYVVNYDYIVNSLCENRDRPALKCNGSCYLSKQLARQQADTDANPFEKSAENHFPQPLFQSCSYAVVTRAREMSPKQPLPFGANQKGVSQLYRFVQPKPPRI